MPEIFFLPVLWSKVPANTLGKTMHGECLKRYIRIYDTPQEDDLH